MLIWYVNIYQYRWSERQICSRPINISMLDSEITSCSIYILWYIFHFKIHYYLCNCVREGGAHVCMAPQLYLAHSQCVEVSRQHDGVVSLLSTCEFQRLSSGPQICQQVTCWVFCLFLLSLFLCGFHIIHSNPIYLPGPLYPPSAIKTFP